MLAAGAAAYSPFPHRENPGLNVYLYWSYILPECTE